MRRTTALKFAAAGSALAVLSIGGATAFAEEEPEPAAVVNKNGHEVDEHAADGQARAAEARAQRLTKAAEREADDEETETPAEEKTNNGNHGGPDEHAGDHPNAQAFENPQPHEPRNDGAHGPRDGYGPNERAGDHPNVNATDGPGGRGGQ
jgi:hypothetical protein